MSADRTPPRATLILTTAAAAIALATASTEPVQAQQQDVPAQIRAWVQTYEKAWNTHDAAAVAAFFSEDADLIMGNAPRVVGRDAIRDGWARYFSRLDEARRGRLAIDSLRVVAPDVVLVNVDSTTSGHRANGEELPTRLARGTWLVARRDGRWQIEALRALPAVGEARLAPGTDR
jgi:uncharacterized protein (TIGR02246 family)